MGRFVSHGVSQRLVYLVCIQYRILRMFKCQDEPMELHFNYQCDDKPWNRCTCIWSGLFFLPAFWSDTFPPFIAECRTSVMSQPRSLAFGGADNKFDKEFLSQQSEITIDSLIFFLPTP